MSTAPSGSDVRDTPRNLIVLSDGTGNSAAKLFKTNVWRFYEALDLNSRDQIAMYDDGVGTASFKPLAVLGGAVGFGLKRNALDLYMFLCRNYQADPHDEARHDKIFAFGFSRGAFTARVVAALVAQQGLVRADDGAELRRLASWAYRAYRAQRYRHTLGVRFLRRLRNGLFRLWDAARGLPRYAPSTNRMVDVEFIGVWDTVAAYGLPIDELTRGWDQWIWPMLPRDRQLSSRVKRARHALALDDERQTFFPLLWDERGEEDNERSTSTDGERISQVWFAGVHSNVGGGYPDDALSYQALCWMATEAEKRGLRFRKGLRPSGGSIPDEWVERASPCAPMNDSRRGLGAYYRYHPRPVERLSNDPDGLVRIARPKIHESVFERIRDGRDSYAPIILPRRYAVVKRDGNILDGDASASPPAPRPNPYEESTQAASRQHLQQSALNAVWERRVVYFATVGATLLVLLLPWVSTFRFVADSYGPLRAVVGMLGAFVPGFAQGWIEHYQERPAQLLGLLAIVGLLMWRSTKLSQIVNDRMRTIWRAQGPVAKPVALAAEPDDWIYRLRTSPAYTGFFRFLSAYFWPNLFGALILFIIAVVLPLRAAFEVTSRAGWLCPSSSVTAAGTGPWEFALDPRGVCNVPGIAIEEGGAYRVQIALPLPTCPGATTSDQPRRSGIWMDGSWRVESSAGIPATRGWVFMAALPFRRVLYENWFVPIATIGTALPERHALSQDVTTFTAGRSGPLTVFVNDAVIPCPGWDCLYRNNSGGPARVRVTRLPSGGPVPPSDRLDPYPCDARVAWTR